VAANELVETMEVLCFLYGEKGKKLMRLAGEIYERNHRRIPIVDEKKGFAYN
jgi:hypothetical protein